MKEIINYFIKNCDIYSIEKTNKIFYSGLNYAKYDVTYKLFDVDYNEKSEDISKKGERRHLLSIEVKNDKIENITNLNFSSYFDQNILNKYASYYISLMIKHKLIVTYLPALNDIHKIFKDEFYFVRNRSISEYQTLFNNDKYNKSYSEDDSNIFYTKFNSFIGVRSLFAFDSESNINPIFRISFPLIKNDFIIDISSVKFNDSFFEQFKKDIELKIIKEKYIVISKCFDLDFDLYLKNYSSYDAIYESCNY